MPYFKASEKDIVRYAKTTEAINPLRIEKEILPPKQNQSIYKILGQTYYSVSLAARFCCHALSSFQNMIKEKKIFYVVVNGRKYVPLWAALYFKYQGETVPVWQVEKGGGESVVWDQDEVLQIVNNLANKEAVKITKKEVWANDIPKFQNEFFFGGVENWPAIEFIIDDKQLLKIYSTQTLIRTGKSEYWQPDTFTGVSFRFDGGISEVEKDSIEEVKKYFGLQQ